MVMNSFNKIPPDSLTIFMSRRRSPAAILYGRTDVLGNADYRERSKSKFGYDLPIRQKQ